MIRNYLAAVAARWIVAWTDDGKGAVLSRTNGYRALLNIFPTIYLSLVKPGEVVPEFKFLELFKRVTLSDDDFRVENYPPGSSGESALAKDILVQLGLAKR